jgi:hypothetical protein
MFFPRSPRGVDTSDPAWQFVGKHALTFAGRARAVVFDRTVVGTAPSA